MFDTKKSVKYLSRFYYYFILICFLGNVYICFKQKAIFIDLEFSLLLFGLCLSLYLYLLHYKRITYEINELSIIKKRDETILKSLPIDQVEYYFLKGRETFPSLKLKDGKIFGFAMTLGHKDKIIDELEKYGIKSITSQFTGP